MRLFTLTFTTAVGLTAAGCQSSPLATAVDAETSGVTAATPKVEKAIAMLQPLGDSEAHGTVHFMRGPLNVTFRAELHGLEPGEHGMHVHVYGDCSAEDGSSAGTHYHFEGGEGDDPELDRISGNLGELVANDSGFATLNDEVPMAELNGFTSIIGRSVVVHADGNDPEKTPIGGAGARVACGAIGIAEPGVDS